MSLHSEPPGMDIGLNRQQIIALVFVILMVISSVAYAASVFV